MSSTPILEFVLGNYKNFNARVTRDALIAYWKHLQTGGKMFWSLAGAMSSAQLGITLAPAIRAGIIHGISSTGANLEESLFRLVANDSYQDFPEVPLPQKIRRHKNPERPNATSYRHQHSGGRSVPCRRKIYRTHVGERYEKWDSQVLA